MVGEAVDIFFLATGVVVDLLDEAAQLFCAAWACSMRPIFRTDAFAAQPRWVSSTCRRSCAKGNAQRIQPMSTGVPVFEVRHVFDRRDGGDDTLVT